MAHTQRTIALLSGAQCSGGHIGSVGDFKLQAVSPCVVPLVQTVSSGMVISTNGAGYCTGGLRGTRFRPATGLTPRTGTQSTRRETSETDGYSARVSRLGDKSRQNSAGQWLAVGNVATRSALVRLPAQRSKYAFYCFPGSSRCSPHSRGVRSADHVGKLADHGADWKAEREQHADYIHTPSGDRSDARHSGIQ